MPLKVDWYYRRNNCATCQKSDAALAKRKAQIVEQVDARKNRLSPAEAIRLARAASELWVARGKSVVRLDMREDPPADAALKMLLIGPSGNLRAPTVRAGKKLFVGFNPEGFAEAFGA